MNPIDTPLDLKDACIEAAHSVIAEHGIEKLSLRDVARKLNVSHQAPYKHYASRDHLLAEVIRRCFKQFTLALNGRKRSAVPIDDMRSLGASYLGYALAHPLEYRLMFGTPWPEPAAHAGLVKDAVHAFDVLRVVLRRVHGAGAAQRAKVDLDAMFIWSNMHGLASIMQANVMAHLELAPKVSAKAGEHIMHMMSLAMAAERR
jgi:AcrR family transcriptional regulator